jgi:hypothetical protein
MPAPRFGETDEEVQNEAQKSILRVFHALILSDFFGASALTFQQTQGRHPRRPFLSSGSLPEIFLPF